jgi:hypothetical protein
MRIKTPTLQLALCVLVTIVFPAYHALAQCPGICAECRSDALSVCGVGCVASVNCSQKDCTCGYSCRPNCKPSSMDGVSLKDDQLKLQAARWNEMDQRYPSSPTVHLRVADQSDMPIAITDSAIHNESGRGLSELTYKIKNQGVSNLREISLMIVFFNDLREPLGGETICEKALSLAPNQERILRVPLGHYVENGQRLWLAIRKFKTDTQSWAGDDQTIVNTIRRYDPSLSD